MPKIRGTTVKCGFLLKKGAHSSNYTKRVAVLLSDRIVVYENPGDSVALVQLSFFRVYHRHALI